MRGSCSLNRTVVIAGILLVALATGCAGPSEPVPATQEEQDYIDQVVARFYLGGYSLNTLSALYDEPQPDSEEWHNTVEALLDQVERLFEGAASLQPPAALTDFHQKVVKTLGHWNAAALLMEADYKAGVYEFSDEVEAELAVADETFQEVDALLNEFLTEHPIPDRETDQSDIEPADDQVPAQESQ